MNLAIFKNLQKEMVVLLVCVLIASISIIISHALKQTSYENRQTAESQLKQARETYYSAINQKALLDKFQSRYAKLKTAGIVGNEHRLNWVDSIENITHRYNIPYLKYKIDKRLPYTHSTMTQVYPSITLYKSAMNLQMQLLHEGDLYTILNALKKTSHGLFDIQSCTIKRNHIQTQSLLTSQTNRNFSARCLLNWYTIQKKTMPVGEES